MGGTIAFCTEREEREKNVELKSFFLSLLEESGSICQETGGKFLNGSGGGRLSKTSIRLV